MGEGGNGCKQPSDGRVAYTLSKERLSEIETVKFFHTELLNYILHRIYVPELVVSNVIVIPHLKPLSIWLPDQYFVMPTIAQKYLDCTD